MPHRRVTPPSCPQHESDESAAHTAASAALLPARLGGLEARVEVKEASLPLCTTEGQQLSSTPPLRGHVEA